MRQLLFEGAHKMKDAVECIIERINKEITSLVIMKEKRKDMMATYADITTNMSALLGRDAEVVRQDLTTQANEVFFAHSQYADFIKHQCDSADVVETNMTTYLKSVIEHLQVYKKEKDGLQLQAKDMEKSLRKMRGGVLGLLDATAPVEERQHEKHEAQRTQRTQRTPRTKRVSARIRV